LYGYILSSIFSLPAYIGPYFIYVLMGVTLSLGLSFTLTYLMVVKGKGTEQTAPLVNQTR
jgi:hypothetical protein